MEKLLITLTVRGEQLAHLQKVQKSGVTMQEYLRNLIKKDIEKGGEK